MCVSLWEYWLDRVIVGNTQDGIDYDSLKLRVHNTHVIHTRD